MIGGCGCLQQCGSHPRRCSETANELANGRQIIMRVVSCAGGVALLEGRLRQANRSLRLTRLATMRLSIQAVELDRTGRLELCR